MSVQLESIHPKTSPGASINPTAAKHIGAAHSITQLVQRQTGGTSSPTSGSINSNISPSNSYASAQTLVSFKLEQTEQSHIHFIF